MNHNGPSDNIAASKPISGFARFCFVAWIATTLLVYFVAFGTRFVVSLFGRIGLDSLGGRLQWLNDGLMTWFSTPGA
jgi:hypothetical protein